MRRVPAADGRTGVGEGGRISSLEIAIPGVTKLTPGHFHSAELRLFFVFPDIKDPVFLGLGVECAGFAPITLFI